MSDELSIQGSLADTTVPDLFRSIIRSHEAAVVSVDLPGRHDSIYFTDGRIVYASSTDPDVGLAETLLRTGELNLQQFSNVMERIVVSRRVGSILVELGYLKPDELTRAIERQASAIVMNAVRFRTGAYTIEFTSTFPDEVIPLPLSTERLILDGIKGIDFWSLIMRGVGRFDRLLQQSRDADTRMFQLELNDDESHVMSLLSAPQTVERLCAQSYLSNYATCRTLWGLISVNFIEDAMGQDVTEARAAEESEYELEDIVERYNTVYQQIFSLVFQKVGDHVYDFMDRVVLHLSPETLPYLSGMSMVNEGRVDFDQLLNNLIASGSQDRRRLFNEVLNELLYGWMYEIKSEFGAPMESEVVRIAQTLKR
jgi:hypothetical protein